MRIIKILTIPYPVYAIKDSTCFATIYDIAHPSHTVKKNKTYWACKYEGKDSRGILLYDESSYITIGETSVKFSRIPEYFGFVNPHTPIDRWEWQLEKCKTNNNNISIL